MHTQQNGSRSWSVVVISITAVLCSDSNNVQASDVEAKQADVCAFRMSAPGPIELGVQVVGGVPADPDRWPGTLKLVASQKTGDTVSNQLCTATVVGRHVIMTAAHCLYERPCKGVLDTPEVAVGIACDILSVDRSGTTIPIDIALCRTTDEKKPIKLKGHARMERLFDGTTESLIGKDIVILGYGCTGQFNTGKKGKLFYGDITVRGLDGDFLHSDSLLDPGSMTICSGDSAGLFSALDLK